MAESSDSQWTEEELHELERAHPEGLSVKQIVKAYEKRGGLTEATFRKYVQLGLLPRSVRVARKGKNQRGSLGLYPATVARRIEAIRRLMAQGLTIQDIQREFVSVSGEIEDLSRAIDKTLGAIARGLEGGRGEDALAERQLEEARALGAELLGKLSEIEKRLSMRARMARAAV